MTVSEGLIFACLMLILAGQFLDRGQRKCATMMLAFAFVHLALSLVRFFI